MDEKKMEEFGGRLVTDLSAAFGGVMTLIGHKLGLFAGMQGEGNMSSHDLAKKTQLTERYVREWLNSQTAAGYVMYDPATQTYSLPDEHAAFLADAASPTFLVPAFDVAAALWYDQEKLMEAFKSGGGIGWHEHHTCLFSGTEGLFKPGYTANLAANWIPALEGVAEKLEKGGKIADIGCGHGASSILLAQAFPNIHVYGSDYHDKSIEVARQRAAQAGVEDRCHFEVADAKSYTRADYDLICFMDCLHDLGDPVGAAKYARQALAADGTIMLLEPFANDNVEDNINPVGRLYYSGSTGICTPNSLSQEVGLGLGAQAGESRLRAVMEEAGFSQFRRATETPFNLVLEAKV